MELFSSSMYFIVNVETSIVSEKVNDNVSEVRLRVKLSSLGSIFSPINNPSGSASCKGILGLSFISLIVMFVMKTDRSSYVVAREGNCFIVLVSVGRRSMDTTVE